MGSLKKVVVAKVKADASLCDKCITGAERQLNALQRAAGSAGLTSADAPYSSSLADLAKIYGDNAARVRSGHGGFCR